MPEAVIQNLESASVWRRMSYDVESARINELAQQVNRCLVLQYDNGNVGVNAIKTLGYGTPAIACLDVFQRSAAPVN